MEYICAHDEVWEHRLIRLLRVRLGGTVVRTDEVVRDGQIRVANKMLPGERIGGWTTLVRSDVGSEDNQNSVFWLRSDRRDRRPGTTHVELVQAKATWRVLEDFPAAVGLIPLYEQVFRGVADRNSSFPTTPVDDLLANADRFVAVMRGFATANRE